jgi:hypothetical protein
MSDEHGPCPFCGATGYNTVSWYCGTYYDLHEEGWQCLKNQRGQLRDELVDALEDIMAYLGRREFGLNAPARRLGWTFTMANSTVVDAGDRLVELGVWEAHPDNEPVSTVRWYRKKAK